MSLRSAIDWSWLLFSTDPTDVKKQIGIFGDLFPKLQLQGELGKMQRWRNGLTVAANLSGFDSQVVR